MLHLPLGTFLFLIFSFFIFPDIILTIFLYMKKKMEKKKILRPPDWPQFRPPTEQETNFFLRMALE